MKLKELRENMKLSQQELADKLGIQRNTVSRYETGAREPDYKTLCAIARLFDVSIDYLLEYPEIKKIPAANDDSEEDEEIAEMIEIMDSLPKHERKRAVRWLRAAYADMQDTHVEADDTGEAKEE